MQPDEFIADLSRDDTGVWRPAFTSDVSYPEAGHSLCHGVEERSFWFGHRNRSIQAVMRRHPAPNDKPFVDVGAGNGFVTGAVQALGYETIAIEPGAAGIKAASDRGVRHVVQASIVDLDVRPGSFGSIGLFDVLEHIDDDSGALNRLGSMLAPGGRIYLTVPAHQWLWSPADDLAGHFRRYTRPTLRRALAEAGFDLTYLSYYFTVLPPPIFLLRTIPAKFGARTDPAERVEQEHGAGGAVLTRILRAEENALAAGREIPFGASLIAVAEFR